MAVQQKTMLFQMRSHCYPVFLIVKQAGAELSQAPLSLVDQTRRAQLSWALFNSTGTKCDKIILFQKKSFFVK